jgi:hypothetical protein
MDTRLRSACILAIGVGGLALLALAQSRPGSPALPPVSNAQPLMRHPVAISMPARLSLQRTPNRLSISYEPASLRTVQITLGKNMVLGVKDELRVYAADESRPSEPRIISKGSIKEKDSGLALSDPNILTSVVVLGAAKNGVPANGKRYVVEHDLGLFETDIPPQHMWQPEGSRLYKVLWEAKLTAVE